MYPAEFDALMTRLNERVFERLEEVRDARRRAKVFAFPQQMATLRDPLTQWVSDVFAAREFDGRILLRGVYFTSGTQEGTPIDRLLGSIGRRSAPPSAVMSPRGPGKAYFVERLLKQVMIGESGLAGVNRRLELRKASLLLGAYVATGLACRVRRGRTLDQLHPEPRFPPADRQRHHRVRADARGNAGSHRSTRLSCVSTPFARSSTDRSLSRDDVAADAMGTL